MGKSFVEEYTKGIILETQQNNFRKIRDTNQLIEVCQTL